MLRYFLFIVVNLDFEDFYKWNKWVFYVFFINDIFVKGILNVK